MKNLLNSIIVLILINSLLIQMRPTEIESKDISFVQASKPSDKTKLTIAIMLPQDYIRLRNFNVCIKKEMDRINKGNWSFTKHFYMDRYIKFLSKFLFFLFIF